MRRHHLSRTSILLLAVLASMAAGCASDVSTAPQYRLRTPKPASERQLSEKAAWSLIQQQYKGRITPAMMQRIETSANSECCAEPSPDAPRRLYSYASAFASGTSGDVVGGAFVDAGAAWVTADGIGSYQEGYSIPYSQTDDCSGVNSCAWGIQWEVRCDEVETTVSSQNTAEAWWVFSHAGPLLSRAGYRCAPSSSGSGGEPTSDGGPNCETYIIEVSNDGGQTWREIGRVTVCE